MAWAEEREGEGEGEGREGGGETDLIIGMTAHSRDPHIPSTVVGSAS